MSQDEGTAVVAQDVAVDEVELDSAPSKKQLQKKERALAGALAGELSGELARLGSAVLDQSGGGTPAQRAWARQKRRDLRQLTAKVADPGVPLEERLRLLQRALASEVEAHIAMEQRALAAEARTAAAKQQADADVAKANASAADSRELTLKLERLCRQMQEQLRVANEASGGWQKRYQLMERQVDALKEITSVSKQQHEALETRNAVLEKANESLRQQAEDLAERMGKHQQHLSAFEDIKAQIQEHGKMFETFDSMKDLLKRQSDEHTLLTTHLESKQQEVSELRDALEKAKQVIELQDATNKQARAEYDRQAKEYTQSVKNAKKLIDDLSKSQEVLPALVKQNKELKASLAAAAAEAEALRGAARRAEAQRDRLEGLCRALRGKGGAAAQEAATSSAAQGEEEGGVEGGAPPAASPAPADASGAAPAAVEAGALGGVTAAAEEAAEVAREEGAAAAAEAGADAEVAAAASDGGTSGCELNERQGGGSGSNGVGASVERRINEQGPGEGAA